MLHEPSVYQCAGRPSNTEGQRKTEDREEQKKRWMNEEGEHQHCDSAHVVTEITHIRAVSVSCSFPQGCAIVLFSPTRGTKPGSFEPKHNDFCKKLNTVLKIKNNQNVKVQAFK